MPLKCHLKLKISKIAQRVHNIRQTMSYVIGVRDKFVSYSKCSECFQKKKKLTFTTTSEPGSFVSRHYTVGEIDTENDSCKFFFFISHDPAPSYLSEIF